jgi:hypothetical protein
VSTQQIPARVQRLFSIYSKLGDDPMTEQEFLAAITRALDRGPGAEADVSAYRHLLVAAEAVRATRNGSGAIVYQKAAVSPITHRMVPARRHSIGNWRRGRRRNIASMTATPRRRSGTRVRTAPARSWAR